MRGSPLRNFNRAAARRSNVTTAAGEAGTGYSSRSFASCALSAMTSAADVPHLRQADGGRADPQKHYGRRGDQAADAAPAPTSSTAAPRRNAYVTSVLPDLRPSFEPSFSYAAFTEPADRAR